MNAPKVLLLGGTGSLGSALLEELCAGGAQVDFTWFRNGERAGDLEVRLGAKGHRADLGDAESVPALFHGLEEAGRLPDAVIHCAGQAPVAPLEEIRAEDWDALQALHGRCALLCAREMALRNLRGALVLVAALDGIRPLPAPAHYAASQAALWGLTQALAKELGHRGILVNLALVGVLEGGISAPLDPAQRDAYARHAALRRTGTNREAARAIRWLALENTYMNGASFPVTGGLE